MTVNSQQSRVESQSRSFPRSAWERTVLTLRVDGTARLPQSGGQLRSHAERGNEALAPRGLTLIELLVVIVILTTIVAAAIPILTPSNDDRRIREASRGVNAFITGAQMKAVELRRPFGVALKRLSIDTGNAQDNAVCQALFYVEQPPAYTGFDESSSARVAFHIPSNANSYGGVGPLVRIQFLTRGNAIALDGLPIGWDADLFPDNLVRPGDVIEISGTQYELLSDETDAAVVRKLDSSNTFFSSDTGKYNGDPDNATTIVARPINDTGQMISFEHDNRGRSTDELAGIVPAAETPFWTYPASYKILRQPMPTAAEPYQMPEGTAIDLRASGVGNDDYFYVPNIRDNADTIVILFAPEGSVSRVSYSVLPPDPFEDPTVTKFDQPVTDNVFLLVGRRDIIPAPALLQDKTLASSTLPAPAAPNRDQLMEELRDPVNWLRGESRWIAIGPQSGRVVTTENAAVDPLVIINKFVPPLSESSNVLRNEQIKAAREFARQMSQMGGG